MRNQTIQKQTGDALALVAELTGKSREMADLIEQEQANLDIARKIFEMRTAAGLKVLLGGILKICRPYGVGRRGGAAWIKIR